MKKKSSKMVEEIGIALIFTSVILFIIGLTFLFFGKQRTKFEGGGIIFIGPIPIIFGTSAKIIYLLLVFSLIFIILFIFFFLNFPLLNKK
ncbi:MAG: DUF131 domain-containing protein [Candidatus Aenigmatarchaeota archaeon]